VLLLSRLFVVFSFAALPLFLDDPVFIRYGVADLFVVAAFQRVHAFLVDCIETAPPLCVGLRQIPFRHCCALADVPRPASARPAYGCLS